MIVNRRTFLQSTLGSAATLAAGAATPASRTAARGASRARRVDVDAIRSPILFRGDRTTAYRDPAVVYHDGTFHAFFTLHRKEADGRYYVYAAASQSRDLVTWTRPEIFTPRDQRLNFASPGNVIRFGGKWVLCLQTYPTPKGETFGDKTSRIWIMRSDDLRTWGEPELLRVKGPDVPREKMGRMIDPYLVEDKDAPGTWWCFYKQRGASLSWSRDLRRWTPFGRIDAGENACVLVDRGEYVLFHSPKNGIGVKRSKDLKRWRDVGDLITLGQKHWPWAQGRLTAGFVLDLRRDPSVGKAILFFHGSTRRGLKAHGAHGEASLALAWSDDLTMWRYPGG